MDGLPNLVILCVAFLPALFCYLGLSACMVAWADEALDIEDTIHQY